MRRIVGALALLASFGCAGAAAYDDFTRGVTENLRGNSENAVASLTVALASSDLASAYKPAAYRGRALAYLRLDKCREGLGDLSTYETLKGRDETILGYRIWAELCLKDAAGAQKDFAELSKGKPRVGDLWEFQRVEWRYGLFEESMKTGQDAFELAEKRGITTKYILLWVAMAAHRAGKFDADYVAARIAQTKLDDWPRPLLDLYLGKQTPEGVQKEATSWRQSKEDAQVCEANFYSAEWYLGRNDTAAATPLLLAVARKCPADFIERPAALSELKRLGVPAPKE